MKFHKTLHTRELLCLQITADMKIEIQEEGIERVYTITQGDEWHTFRTISNPQVGDYLIRAEDHPTRLIFLTQEQYRQKFTSVPADTQIQVDADNRRVRVYFGDVITNRFRVADFVKQDRAWIIQFVEDTSGYDMVSALNVHAAIASGIEKIKQIDPEGWFIV